MGFYERHILPKVINWACGQKPSMMQRAKVIPLAEGKVLEIGIGSGLNLPIYKSEKVKHLTGIDPSKEIWNINVEQRDKLEFEYDFIQAFAEQLTVDSSSMDTVVTTYTMCTIPDLQKAFEEIRRVLRKGGRVSEVQALRLRIRYFTNGLVLGSAVFVNEIFSQFRDRFRLKRKTGARRMARLPFGGLRTCR